MSKSLVDIAKEYSRAWAEHDPDAIAAMQTDDSVFHLHDICTLRSRCVHDQRRTGRTQGQLLGLAHLPATDGFRPCIQVSGSWSLKPRWWWAVVSITRTLPRSQVGPYAWRENPIRRSDGP